MAAATQAAAPDLDAQTPPVLHTFDPLDWIVLIAYGVGMLAVGWFYSRVKNVEEYLLGGREMKPWAVGISLFATIMSTLTYLAVPGEMIRHGPMILCIILSYPFVYLVVSRFIIPSFMKLRVTSANEILEERLGLSVRLLGAILFLSLRLLWMSLIVYATTEAVVVPLMRLDPAMTPWISVVMVALTVIYTSLGGLQAVVFTDVLQTFIMLAGAVLSLVLITASLGGVSAWWPTQWAANWDPPSFFFSPGARVSIGMAILSQFTWYVCTVSSDQMAIQRYLATRDTKSASRMLGISLCCDAAVASLLALLGLALFAYFQANPQLLPAGETITSSADKLLPRFIVTVLPAGISGLVVAGVLSAAMDSLSSGVNAACSVVTVDCIDRFRTVKLHGKQHVAQARWVSCLIGLVVVGLSLLAVYIPGNLLEKCYTVVNLLTAPLFVLFLLAMFIPWSTPLGAWCATVAGVSIAMAMAYKGFLGLSFLWITPVSLLTGVIVGVVVSAISFRQKRSASSST